MNAPAKRYFSADTESQAIIDAAEHFGLPPGELAYRPVEKKHGFLRRPRVVIEVDPANPRRTAPAPAPEPRAAAAGGPQHPPAAGRSGSAEAAPAVRREHAPALLRGEGTRREGPATWERGAGFAKATGAAGAVETAQAVVALGALPLEVAAHEVEGPDGGELRVELRGPGRPALVARQGELLRACEYLLRRMVRELPAGGLSVDSDGFREQRDESLRKRALAAAAEVRRSGEPVLFEPLPAAERRILHLAIQAEPGVASASEGEGELRRVRVSVGPEPSGADPRVRPEP